MLPPDSLELEKRQKEKRRNGKKIILKSSIAKPVVFTYFDSKHIKKTCAGDIECRDTVL
jgi:hypothetical protein